MLSFILGFALGGIAFSICASVLYMYIDQRSKKTPYEIWLNDVREHNVIRSRDA